MVRGIVVSMIVFLTGTMIMAEEFTSVQSGNWGNKQTWGGDKIPDVQDEVTIEHTVTGNGQCRWLYIEAGGILQNADIKCDYLQIKFGGTVRATAGSFVKLSVDGSIINKGTVEFTDMYSPFTVRLEGNLTNTGRWHPSQTHFTNAGVQAVTSSPVLYGDYYLGSSSCILRARTDLRVDGKINLQSGFLDMQGKALTTRRVCDGTISNIRQLTAFETGKIGSQLTIESESLILSGSLATGTQTYIYADVVIQDTLENKDGPGWIEFFGSVRNDGVVHHDPDDHRLTVIAHGDIDNRGVWNPGSTRLTGTANQHLSLAEERQFSGPFYNYKGGEGSINAGSSLTFTDEFDLVGDTLSMGYHNLRMDGGNVHNGYVKGDFELFGTFRGNNTTFLGDVIVRDSLTNSHQGPMVVRFLGSVENTGVIQSHPNDNRLQLTVTGDVTNSGVWQAGHTSIDGDGPRQILGAEMEGTIYASRAYAESGGIVFRDENILPRLELKYGVGVRIDSAASLTLTEGELSGSLSGIRNYGRITLCRAVDSTWTGDFYQAHLMFPDITGLDSVIASSCGGQQPPGFTGAVSQWWHVCSTGDSIRTDTADITFWYEDTMLNNLPEDQLEVWHSADSGRSWHQVSNESNRSAYEVSNQIKVRNVPLQGMYALGIQGPTGIEDHDTRSSPIVPARVHLSQNYPNPFNPMTTIRYGLPEAGHVRLTIYDLRGERITSLVAGQQSAGWHSIRWDGTDQFGEQVCNGVYFYRLVADKYMKTRKMVLLK